MSEPKARAAESGRRGRAGESGGPSRCEWAGETGLMLDYHDRVWGVPERDPTNLFELLVLEGAQAGLSWRTILEKQVGYRQAFAGFDPAVVAGFGVSDTERLLADAGIVRNRAKIGAAIDNARAWLELDEPVAYLWGFVDDQPVQNSFVSLSQLPARTDVSDRMSKELKQRGFRFVGPTICYAFMQACGMVNDHVTSCFRHAEVAALG
jgi:DNA-3-methyladenine glycosylase I